MKLALCGYGKMGRLLKELAPQRGHSAVAIDPEAPGADFKRLDAAALRDADVCIDFSRPAAAVENLRIAAEYGCSVVMGTTGWHSRMEEVQRLVAENQIGFIHAANFSIGVNLFYRIAAGAARLMGRFEQYDAAGVEYHHSGKADSPSGTAHALAEILTKNIPRKTRLVFDRLDRPIAPEELHFASVRCGSLPGTHEIVFDSEADTITLRHTARSRIGFASGALAAAEWLCGKRGFFTIDDLLRDLLAGGE